jgi:putative transposase
MNARSEDLRTRVINYIEKGGSHKEAIAIFEVSSRSIYRWIKLKKETGNLEVRPVPRSPHKLPNEELLEYVRCNPDAHLKEIAAHFKCGISSVYDALKRLGVTYKKTPFICGTRRRKEGKIQRFCKNDAKKASSLC